MTKEPETLRFAQHVVNRCIEEEHPITLLQLQSVLWFADALFVSRTGRQLLDEPFVVQPLGPRLLSVQSDFFGYGADPITRRRDIGEVPPEARDALDEVLPYCLQEDRRTLSEITRANGGSYDTTYKDGTGREEPIDGPVAGDLAPLLNRFVAPAVEAMNMDSTDALSLDGFGL